jgi:hypothetical protein
MDIKRIKENETLLLRYPDLYGPIEQLNPNETNVCDDMLNQINANKHRIQLLDNLNKKLYNSIKKLNETQVDEMKSNQNKSYDSENKDYFLKHEGDDLSRSTTKMEVRKSSEKKSISRPVPLFKLENEIDQELEIFATEQNNIFK